MTSSNILIREATHSDHDQLKAVSHDAHATLRKVYRPGPSAKAIGTENPYTRIVAIKGGLLVGMATYEVDGDSIYFGSLGVLDHYRKQGVARALVRHIEGIALKEGFKKLTCATVEETRNVPIFEKLGFKIISRAIPEKFESLIGTPIHEVTMEKLLVPGLAPWNHKTYLVNNLGRTPRKLYLQAINNIQAVKNELPAPPVAVDIGCGVGIETADLVQRGFTVYAIEKEPDLIQETKNLIGNSSKVEFLIRPLEEIIDLPRASFVYAYHTLHFCDSFHFNRLWKTVTESVLPSGVFAGSFFGMHDDWVKAGKATGITVDQIRTYLAGFEILHLNEIDQTDSSRGNEERWNFVDVIARKS